MKLSTVIVTHNRREALRHTLTMMRDNAPLAGLAGEVIVVDNGSTDDTAAMLGREHPGVRVLRRARNEGVSARNHAFAVASGEYVMLCDDDSYPVGDAANRAVAYLAREPRCAAVGGRVELLDGRCEASALPTVTINCGVVLRKRVIDEVGGLPTEFFRQAEEYDWSFRAWGAGYRVERFEDLVWRHNKAAGNRPSGRVHRYDVRNNLILLERYVPEPLRSEYRRDWVARYGALARSHGRRLAHLHGRWSGWCWSHREARRGRRVLRPEAIEAIFGLEAQGARVRKWASDQAIGRVLIADMSKNLYATWRACEAAGLKVVGIAENGSAFAGMAYRGAVVQPDEAWRAARFDGVVLSNVNPAQVEARAAQLAARFGRPLLTVWRPRLLGARSADAATAAA